MNFKEKGWEIEQALIKKVEVLLPQKKSFQDQVSAMSTQEFGIFSLRMSLNQ
jgi:hypothetical protein